MVRSGLGACETTGESGTGGVVKTGIERGIRLGVEDESLRGWNVAQHTEHRDQCEVSNKAVLSLGVTVSGDVEFVPIASCLPASSYSKMFPRLWCPALFRRDALPTIAVAI